MKINIIVERANTVFDAKNGRMVGSESTKEILEDITSMVEELCESHPTTICRKMVEVTITEKR